MYYRIKQITLLFGDLVMLSIGFFLSLSVRYFQWPSNQLISSLVWPLAELFFVATIIFFIIGLYDIGRAKNTWPFFQKIILSGAVWLILSIVFFYINPVTRLSPKTILLLTSIISFGLVALWRCIYNRFLSTTFLQTNIVFVGLTPEVVELIKLFIEEPQRGYGVIGIIKDTETLVPAEIINVPTAETMDGLLKQKNYPYPEVIITASQLKENKTVLNELYRSLFSQTSVIDLAEFYEQIFKRVPPFIFSESWFMTHLNEQNKKMYDRFRIFLDYLAAMTMGIFFLLFSPFIALAIKLSSPGPVLFRQTRIGRLEKPFTMYKFRTMKSLNLSGSAEVNGPQYAKENDNRITGVGKILRRTHLDELPQLINILKGEMGIVGPRPERPEFVNELTKKMPFYALRHLIKPGLTGWAQLQRSYYENVEENLYKLQYDLYYLRNRGLALDIAILLRTIDILMKLMGR